MVSLASIYILVMFFIYCIGYPKEHLYTHTVHILVSVHKTDGETQNDSPNPNPRRNVRDGSQPSQGAQVTTHEYHELPDGRTLAIELGTGEVTRMPLHSLTRIKASGMRLNY